MVRFGEQTPQGPWKQSVESVRHCDLLIAVGTSGVVYPAASLPAMAKAAGARVMEINPVATELSVQADLSWRTTAAKGLPALVALVAAC